MQLRCHKTYFDRRSRCTYSTYGYDEYCRWHKIIREFHQDLARFHFLFPQFMMFGVYYGLVIAGYSFWNYSKEPAVIWLYGMLFFTGLACKYFADAIIAKDYPLSQFTLWAKLLASGLLLELIAGLMFIIHTVNTPGVIQPAIDLVTTIPNSSVYGPPLLIIIATIVTGANIRLFVDRILFRKLPKYLTEVVPFIVMSIIMLALQPAIDVQFPAISRENLTKFWESIIGPNFTVAYGIAFVAAFVIAEIINPGMRHRAFEYDSEGFKNTIWPSFPVCYGSPMLAILASGFILARTGITGAVPFVILSIVVVIPLCIVGTRWVINAELSRR